MTGSTFIDSETLRCRQTRTWLGNGQFSEWQESTDLRGTPIGDRAEVWEWDRLVYPGRKQHGRRVREYIKVMHCPEGWHSTSGSARRPMDPEICSTMLHDQWQYPGGGFDRDKYRAHHDVNPVVWIIKVKRHTRVRIYRYCDPELPAEYRPRQHDGVTVSGCP
jgi:hypothetical protein